MVKTALIEALKDILNEQGITDIEPVVEKPADMNHGDYTTNIAMIAAKKLGKNPRELAEIIKAQIANGKWKLEHLDKVEVAGPGFINFWISKEELLKNVQEYASSETRSTNVARTVSPLQGKKIVIEFAHPNTHKALHIGHLRNIATGESLVRLLESQGVQVIRANYQGDVGMHIAKALYGLLHISPFKEQLSSITGVRERVGFLGKAYAAGSQAYESDPAAKEKIHDYNYLVYASAQRFQEEKGMPGGSTNYLEFVKGRSEDIEQVYGVWKETRQWSLDYYEEMYKQLDTHFDRYFFESECLEGVDKAKEAVRKGVLTESEGAIVFLGEPHGLDTRVFVNSLGLPTYEAKELALAEKEFSEFGTVDKVIHVVGPEQASFFRVTFKVEELLSIQKDQQYHLAYGWVRLKQGKMSSRLGKVITAEQLLDVVKEEIRGIQEKSGIRSEEIDHEKLVNMTAVAAIKYSFLKVSTNQEIAFDLQESISAEGNSGPYLQYTFARTQSVLRKSEIRNPKFEINSNFQNIKLETEELNLLRKLYQFTEVVQESAENYSPNILCNYLFDLAQQFNLFYQKVPILKSDDETRTFRLGLTTAVGKTIKEGLYLLGIEAPEEM